MWSFGNRLLQEETRLVPKLEISQRGIGKNVPYLTQFADTYTHGARTNRLSKITLINIHGGWNNILCPNTFAHRWSGEDTTLHLVAYVLPGPVPRSFNFFYSKSAHADLFISFP